MDTDAAPGVGMKVNDGRNPAQTGRGANFSADFGKADRLSPTFTSPQNETFRDGGQNRKEKAQQNNQVDESYSAIPGPKSHQNEPFFTRKDC